jgi:hypothetical protein
MGEQWSVPPSLNREERVLLYSLDGPDAAIFRGSAPHSVQRFVLALQNVDTRDGRSIELSWEAPGGRSARLFDIDYPEPVKLRPGCVLSVVITLRTEEEAREEAWLHFTVGGPGGGVFRVPLLSVEPQLQLEVRPCAPGWAAQPFQRVKQAP